MSNEESEKISVLTERIDNLLERLDRFERLFGVPVVERFVYGGGAVDCNEQTILCLHSLIPSESALGTCPIALSWLL